MQTEIIKYQFSLPEKITVILRQTILLLQNHFYVTLVESSPSKIIISNTKDADIRVSEKFILAYTNKDFNHHNLMLHGPLIYCNDGTPDYLGTCAYMVNFLQEYSNKQDDFDELDRFKYEKSYQHRFDCTTKNLVLNYLIHLVTNCEKTRHLKRKKVLSKLWATHDIDYIYKNWMPEFRTALRTFKIKQLINILTRRRQNPDALIFEKILSINQKNKIKSTFFWLASQKDYRSCSGKLIQNANYNINSQEIQNLIGKIRSFGFELGVHQSLGCEDIAAERDIIDPEIEINRNHYLAGKLQNVWSSLEMADIKKDASAGFSQAIGFRNSYGLPIQPIDPVKNRPYDLTIYPLHIMDATLIKAKTKPDQAFSIIQNFLLENKFDCEISILWHNNYFSNVKFPGWGDLYEKILNFYSSKVRKEEQ